MGYLTKRERREQRPSGRWIDISSKQNAGLDGRRPFATTAFIKTDPSSLRYVEEDGGRQTNMRSLKQLIAWTMIICAARCEAATPVYGYKVVATYPHSTKSYTEGFFYRNGLFYEGTGLKGQSQVLVYEPSTGILKVSVNLPSKLFGEGIVDWGPNLYEWTWQDNVGFVRDRNTLKVLRQFTYSGEGWGMTRNLHELITSDGSSTLTFRNPIDFSETRRVVVKDGNQAITQLNELEFVKGEIYANVWHTDRIARISPKDGRVLGWIDLSGIISPMFKLDSEAVLNGIAYDAQHDRLFITGKQWPSIFEIKLTVKR